MKNCADDFLEVLKLQLKRTITDGGQPVNLKTLINFDSSNAVFSRLSKFNNDKLSGVNVLFSILMYSGECGVSDYPDDIATSVTMPPLTIHPLHKQ